MGLSKKKCFPHIEEKNYYGSLTYFVKYANIYFILPFYLNIYLLCYFQILCNIIEPAKDENIAKLHC